jgi:predicted Holliday junction resolvase-like endonuclease
MILSSELTTSGGVILILLVLALVCIIVLCVIRIRVLQAKLVSHKSSLQSFHVKVGNIAEQMAPFSSAFPWDPEGFKFLGKPIDGIQFENDRIILVEFKTGKSQLSKDQRRIKNLVTNREVYFEEVRFG